MVMHSYSFSCNFTLLLHALILLQADRKDVYSITMTIQKDNLAAEKVSRHFLVKRLVLGKTYEKNIIFSYYIAVFLFTMVLVTWLTALLVISGNVHPNPGPYSPSSTATYSSFNSSHESGLISKTDNLAHHLSFVHYNIQSIITKLDILSTELYDFDILAFSETWLGPSTLTEDINLESYLPPERKDRTGDNHGGVLIYVKDTIYYKRRLDLEPIGIECIWIEVQLRHKKVLFGLFYRPPNSDAEYFSSIEDSIFLAIDTGIKDVVITGDFNCNMFNPRTARKINSICEQLSLYQVINDPTHFTENSSSLIDIILTKDKDSVILSGVGEPFLQQEVRYHCPVFGILNFSKPKRKSYIRQVWFFDRGNYDLLRNEIALTDWTALESQNIDTFAQNITEHVISLSKAYIPNKSVTIRPSDPPWLTTNIRKHIRRRKRAYKKAKLSKSAHNWNTFKNLRNTVTNMIRNSKKAFMDNLANKLKSETLSAKDWWTTLKFFISPNTNSSIPTLEHDGIIYSDDTDKANLLNNFFRDQTLLNESNVILPRINKYVAEGVSFSSLMITPDEIELVLKSLPVGKAVGPDGINNRILREIAHEFSVPFCSLVNLSLQLGMVPDIWKVSNVCPIYKKDDPTLVSNYRPISLLNALDKVTERVIFKHLYNYLRDSNILTPLQSGFIPKDSTINQLTFLYDKFCQALDDGKEVRVVFCDISKAFDRVWHAGLLCKLEAVGVSGNLLLWFRSYLSNRRQRVVLPGVHSNWNYIKAGVPQGSILGPLLFLLYINDIVNDIGSHIRLFADDTSLYIVVENPDEAAELLNADLDKITTWAEQWLVTFNPPKTESMLISRKIVKPLHPPIFMSNQQISEVQFHKHLGIFLSNDCTWHKHIEYIKGKAWKRINVMRRLKFQLDRKSLEKIYLSFIRPILEYGNEIWANCTQYEKDELEQIQLEAARIATGATKLISINNLYSEIGWETLDERRNKQKLLMFYKLYYSLSPPYLSTLVPPLVGQTSRYNLRNANDLQTIDARTTLYFNSFLPSTVRDWNSLPPDIKNADTAVAFKSSLNKNNRFVPKHFYFGDRQLQILHTRLRTKCSSLNYDIFLRRLNDSPLCTCGDLENAEHFLLQCPFYQQQRLALVQSISQHCQISSDLLLYGDTSMPLDINRLIFEAVQKYIQDSKRF